MTEQQIGWRKVIVTLLGQVPIVVALLYPQWADQANALVGILVTVIIPIVFESGVIAYLFANVKQKTDLAKMQVELTKAQAELERAKTINPTISVTTTGGS